MKYKFKGYHWFTQQGCLVFSEPKRVAVYTEDSFDSLKEAKTEWIKDPWIEDGEIIFETEVEQNANKFMHEYMNGNEGSGDE